VMATLFLFRALQSLPSGRQDKGSPCKIPAQIRFFYATSPP
jgi:hypothetical protein